MNVAFTPAAASALSTEIWHSAASGRAGSWTSMAGCVVLRLEEVDERVGLE